MVNKLILLFFFTTFCYSENITFIGYPDRKVEISSPIDVIKTKVTKIDEFKVLISQDNDDYFWSSRNNVRLIKIENGFFITYVAEKGQGYIRICTATKTYVEHLTLGLSSISYFGVYK